MTIDDEWFQSFTFNRAEDDLPVEQARLYDWLSSARRSKSEEVEYMLQYIEDTTRLRTSSNDPGYQLTKDLGIACAFRMLADKLRDIDDARALEYYSKSMLLSRRTKDRREQASCLAGLARLAWDSNDIKLSGDLFVRAASRAFSDDRVLPAFQSLWCVSDLWESNGRSGDAAVIMELLAGFRNVEMIYLVESARLLKKSRKKRRLREWRKASTLANCTIWDVARSAAAHYVEEDHQMALDLGQMLLADAERRADGDAVRNFAYFVHLANEAIFANRAISEPATGQTINEDTEKQIDAD